MRPKYTDIVSIELNTEQEEEKKNLKEIALNQRILYGTERKEYNDKEIFFCYLETTLVLFTIVK